MKRLATRRIELEVSPELLALIRGFAGYYRQTPETYIRKAVLTCVEADCEGRLDKHLPENRTPEG